jgi:hypothetical protein
MSNSMAFRTISFAACVASAAMVTEPVNDAVSKFGESETTYCEGRTVRGRRYGL